jgi:nitrite reductase (NADH) small subunit/3-phenylpropionate/trans-cinnamate dioxygenase ferredoxin subunit
MTTLSRLRPGTMVEKQILARKIAVVNDNGSIFGIQGECAHMRASLANGAVKDGIVTCSWHGWKYDLQSGECLTKPGFTLKKYEVEIDGDDVYLLL